MTDVMIKTPVSSVISEYMSDAEYYNSPEVAYIIVDIVLYQPGRIANQICILNINSYSKLTIPAALCYPGHYLPRAVLERLPWLLSLQSYHYWLLRFTSFSLLNYRLLCRHRQ